MQCRKSETINTWLRRRRKSFFFLSFFPVRPPDVVYYAASSTKKSFSPSNYKNIKKLKPTKLYTNSSSFSFSQSLFMDYLKKRFPAASARRWKKEKNSLAFFTVISVPFIFNELRTSVCAPRRLDKQKKKTTRQQQEPEKNNNNKYQKKKLDFTLDWRCCSRFSSDKWRHWWTAINNDRQINQRILSV